MQDNIRNIIDDLLNHRLTRAIKRTKPVTKELKDPDIIANIEDIEQTTKAMFHYMELNADDPERMNLYHSLLKRTYCAVADLDLIWLYSFRKFYSELHKKGDPSPKSSDLITTILESFVSDLAMLSLEPDNDETRKKKADIYERHQKSMSELFAAVAMSCQWSKDLSEFWTDMITSPTIDTSDALLLTSGITLGALTEFDINRTITLADIYANASDTALRQRALTGFVLSVDSRMIAVYPEIKETIKRISALPGAAHEIFDLQKQIFYCINAERDRKKIEDEIMPDIKKAAQFGVNSNGMIEEKENDKLQDILHPEAEEEATEKIEESLKKITEMQEQGSDIYFSGFSHMKRFPFFSTASNWFLPYSTEQPDVAKARQRMDGGKFLDMIISRSAFCESDKYSLTFAAESIYSRIPPKLREIITSSDTVGIEIPKEEAESPAFVRRQYLQDLYRFFMLHPQHDELPNPFSSEKRRLFLGSNAFQVPELKKFLPSLAVFLHDQGRYEDMYNILKAFGQKQRDTLTFHLLRGTYYNHIKEYQLAVDAFSKALEKAPDNEMALRGAARAGMMAGEFDFAADAYGKLLEIRPGYKSYLVNKALALMNNEEYDDAAKSLYEADYRYPHDDNVARVKAWLFMYKHEPDKALELLRKITAGKHLSTDVLVMGYAMWTMGDYGGAAKAFRTFLKETESGDLDTEFNKDRKLLEDYGILEDDRYIMEDLVDETE